MSVIYRAFTGLAAGAVAISAANAAAIDLAVFAGAGGDLSPKQPCPCVCNGEKQHQDTSELASADEPTQAEQPEAAPVFALELVER